MFIVSFPFKVSRCEPLNNETLVGDNQVNFSTLIVIMALFLSASFLNEARSSSYDRIASQDSSHRLVSPDISFKEKSAAHGLTEDGFEFSALLWESTDGVAVFFRIINCKTPAKASSTLSTLTKDASKIFERTIVKGKDGKRIGQRIVAAFSGREPLQRPEVILWTQGAEVYRVESSSFSHALLFEKKWPNL